MRNNDMLSQIKREGKSRVQGATQHLLPPADIVVALILSAFLLSGCSGGGGGGGGGVRSPDSINSGSSSRGSTVTVENATTWLIPVNQIVDGGPGKDGIPALTNPAFVPINQAETSRTALVIGIKAGGVMQAIPHDIMDWHEVLNDTVAGQPFVLSYCPLTGSALMWESSTTDADPTFGVSGLLYDSNIILYDRQTDSFWSQMQIRAVQGERSGEVPTMLPLVEMTLASWEAMYPDSTILSRQTGFSRNYGRYPYGSFRTDDQLLFQVSFLDNRLHEKARVIGIEMNGIARAYEIDRFEPFSISIINDTIDGVPIVVIGSSGSKYGVIFERTLTDGTVLTFSESTEPLPSVVSDDEGNTWDLFGEALTGPRAGERLPTTTSHIAYWFAWGAFHQNSEIFSQ